MAASVHRAHAGSGRENDLYGRADQRAGLRQSDQATRDDKSSRRRGLYLRADDALPAPREVRFKFDAVYKGWRNFSLWAQRAAHKCRKYR